MPEPNRHVEAFKESVNVLGLSTAAALSAAMLNPLPLLVGLVAEAAYLLFVPDSRWYEARLSRRHDAEVERRRQELKSRILPELRPELRARFERLEETRHEIGAQPMEGETWFREVLRKLDYLLEKFLLFAGKEVQFRGYVRSVLQEIRGAPAAPAELRMEVREDRRGRRIRVPPPAAAPLGPAGPPGSDAWVEKTIGEIRSHYEAESEKLRALREQEQDPNTRAVLEKRLEVLQRRHEGIGKVGRILVNLSHQLELLEDTFGLINDEIRARSPEQVLADIEDVVWQTETMTKLLEDLAPLEQVAARLGA